MRFLLTVALAICAVVGVVHPAFAQWQLMENGLGEQTANVGDDNGHTLVVRCSAGGLEIWYYAKDPAVRPLQPGDTFLVFAFDGGPAALALPASKEPIEGNTLLKVTGLNATTVAGLVAGADRSVTVGVATASSSASGTMIDPATFSARGSTANVNSVRASCVIPELNWAGPALGLPLSSFKALKLEGDGAARVICSDDTEEGGSIAEAAKALATFEEGQVQCAWHRPNGEGWVQTTSALASVQMKARFTFALQSSATEPELVHVYGAASPANYDVALRVLLGLYGESEHEEKTMNADGSLEDGAEDVWYLGPYAISLSENFFAYGSLTFSYDDRRVD